MLSLQIVVLCQKFHFCLTPITISFFITGPFVDDGAALFASDNARLILLFDTNGLRCHPIAVMRSMSNKLLL